MADINISKLKLPNDNNTYHYKDTVSGYKSTDATQSEHGLLSTTDKIKLDGIATGAEVNQNAFSNVKVGSTTVAADSKTDTLELVAGTNVTLTPDATNDKVTITAKDTTYSDATTSASGLMSASDKTKLNGIASGAEVNQNAFSNVVVGSTTVAADSKTDTLTLVGGANITLAPDATNDKITISLDDTVDTGEVIATDIQAGNLIVNGTSRFLNTINGTASNSEKLNGQSLTSTYSSTGTAPITGAAVASAIGTLDGTVSGSPSASKTLTAFSQTDGKVSATFGNISITKSQVSDFPTLGTAAAKNYITSVTSGSADLVTSGAVWTAIDNLPEPMVFKGSLGTGGTISALPVDGTAKVGDTYKVITAGTYASKAAKVGDTFICLTKTSSANTWELIPSGDEPSGTVTSVGISNGGGLSVSGSPITSSGTITISHADTSSQASVNNSGRTYIQDITLDTYGHVTGIASATETVVNTDRYVNSAAFAHDSTNDNVKMTLTRAGSDTATVTANIPKVSSSSAGVAPKGATVSSQSQTTKFLREDGTWQAPSYTPVIDNLTSSTSTTSALSAKQGYLLANGSARDNTKLPLAGGTMTGLLKAQANIYTDSYTGALDMQNSNIYGVNSIITADLADNAGEGIHFYRDSTHVDTLWVAGGDIMFVPNRALGTSTTAANSQKVGRFTANPTSGQVVITDGTTGGIKSSGYTIAKSVPSNADFTNTWRPVQDNLTSTSTTDCLSANQGKVLNDSKLEKTTYEWNKEVSFGSSGYLKIGSFAMYDSNVTIEINSTASTTYHGTLVIATQNVTSSSIGSVHVIKVYDDPTGVIAESLRIVWTNGSRNYDIYFVPSNWSKNLIHIQALGLYGYSDICTAQTGTAPTTTSGLEPINVLESKSAASGGTDVSMVTTGEKATWNAKGSGTITSVKTTAGAHTTINVTSGAANFNVPTKTSHLTNDSGFVTTDKYVEQSATTTSNYRKIVLSYQDGAAGAAVETKTNVVYVTANAEVQPSTGNIRSAGTVSAANLSASGNVSGTTFGVISSSGTGGGISLYNGTGNVTTYGIAMRRTTDSGKHGYVQGDWGIYNYMSGGTTRGWVWRYGNTTNVASISSEGHAAFTGSVTIGANTTNTSGVRQVYNSTTKSLDFVFVA